MAHKHALKCGFIGLGSQGGPMARRITRWRLARRWGWTARQSFRGEEALRSHFETREAVWAWTERCRIVDGGLTLGGVPGAQLSGMRRLWPPCV